METISFCNRACRVAGLASILDSKEPSLESDDGRCAYCNRQLPANPLPGIVFDVEQAFARSSVALEPSLLKRLRDAAKVRR